MSATVEAAGAAGEGAAAFRESFFRALRDMGPGDYYHSASIHLPPASPRNAKNTTSARQMLMLAAAEKNDVPNAMRYATGP